MYMVCRFWCYELSYYIAKDLIKHIHYYRVSRFDDLAISALLRPGSLCFAWNFTTTLIHRISDMVYAIDIKLEP